MTITNLGKQNIGDNMYQIYTFPNITDEVGKHDEEIKALVPSINIERLTAEGAKNRNKYLIKLSANGASMQFNYSSGVGIEHHPTLTDVLYALLSDMSCIEDIDVDDFLREMSCDASIDDVRKGEEVFRAIVKQTKSLHKLRLPLAKLNELLQDY